MKKVAHIINSKIYSGLENVVCTIMEYFRENYKDIDMVYVTQDGPIVDVLKEKKLNYYIIDKMNTKNINKLIKEYKPDILHAHDFTASVICALTNTKIPIVNHLHNNSPWIKKINKNSLAYLYAGIKAKKILTVSSSIENEYVFSKFIKNKIVMIGNPVSRKKILSMVDESDFVKKYDICCVARLTEQKNPQKFINIIEKVQVEIPNIKAVWVGNGELKEECKLLVKEKGLENNIELVGFQKNPYKFMAASKVFLLTSDWEGFGLVAFEALTLGLPCVVSNVGGLPGIVDDSCGFLSNNTDEIAIKIVLMLKNDDIMKKTSKNAIDRSLKLENCTNYFNLIKKIYNDFIS